MIDNGSGYLKAGWGGDKAPSVLLRNIIGHPLDEHTHELDQIKELDEGLEEHH